MVMNDKTLQEEDVYNKPTLEDTAMELAELVLRAYERELRKKGDNENGKKNG